MPNRFLLFAMNLSLSIASASAQVPREITALIIDPNTPTTIYAGTHSAQNWAGSNDGGVYKSTDAGQSWTLMSSGMGVIHIRALAIDPINSSTIYAGTRNSGVFKTTDGGKNWTPTNEGLTSLLVQSLAIDPINPSIIYAGTRDQGIFKSSDGGKNWNAVNAGLTAFFVQALAIDPINPATIYAGTRASNVFREGASKTAVDGVFKSTDGGETWAQHNRGISRPFIQTLAIDPRKPSTLYAGTDVDGVFKSMDGGESWAAINGNLFSPFRRLFVRAVVINPVNPLTIFLSEWGSGVFKSIDGGQSWTFSGPTAVWLYSLAINPADPKSIYAGTVESGVSSSTDGGITWRDPKLPMLTLASPIFGAPNAIRYCTGTRWDLEVRNALPNASIELSGISNDHSWVVPNWRTSDSSGILIEGGTFSPGAEGTHLLRVQVGGVASNSLSFVVANCIR